MYKKLIIMMFLVVFFTISSTRAENIVWVGLLGSTTANEDQKWIDMLKAQGHTIITQGSWQEIGAAEIATMNNADLVIFSTNAGTSVTFSTSAEEAKRWNSITKPILCMNPAVTRGSGNYWKWLTGSTARNNVFLSTIVADVPSHPVFDGVSLDASNQTTMYTTTANGIYTVDGLGVGNGTLIAHKPSDTLVLIALWEPGIETYPGSGVIPPAQRMLFGAAYYAQYNINATGEKIFINAVNFLLPDPALASKAYPANGSTEISIDVGLISWKPGSIATTHNVFLGTDKDSVSNATIANPLGTTVYAGLALDSNSIPMSRLEFNTTYYWRVDETPGTGAGFVWSFKTELEGYPLAPASIINVTASDNCAYPGEQEPNFTSKGLGLDANSAHSDNYKHMWLGQADELGQIWIQYEFDKVYKLNDMLVWNYNEPNPGESYGAKDVNITYSIDGVTWQALGGTVQFNQATGLPNYKANTTIDFDGAIAKYVKLTFWSAWDESNILGGVSEVKFSAMPTRVQTPVPATAAANIAVNQVLSWKAGRGVDIHKLYIGTDSNSVRDGLVTAVDIDSVSYAPVLELSRTYYWRVDEVNTAEAFTTWDGPVWSFATVQNIIVDSFEKGYDDSDANAVWATWTGWEDATNGGSMGNPGTPYLSSTITYNGNRAAPFFYDNSTKVYSEVRAQVAELPIGTSDWTKGAPTSLVIWFRGDPNNTQAQMYAKLNNSKVLYDGDPIQLTQSLWRPWVIELSKFNINMSNVTSIAIGLDRTVTPAVPSRIYIDYITLYRVAPPVAAAPVNPGNTGLIARYSMENNVLDSSGNGNNGTIIDTPTFEPGLGGYGMAMAFSGPNDCVDLGNKAVFNPAGSFSVSLWAKISSWSSAWNHVMVSNRGEGTVGWQIRRSSGTNLCFTTRGISNDDMTSTAAAPPLNEWVHITCVYDSDAFTKSIYMNGLLDRTISLTGTVKVIGATTHNSYIGARADSANTGREAAYFTGMIDEVRMYNRALSAGEAAFLGDPTP